MSNELKREILKVVSEQDCMLLEMKYIEGYSYEEIAERTGLKSGTLRSRVHRAAMKIQTSFKHSDLSDVGSERWG